MLQLWLKIFEIFKYINYDDVKITMAIVNLDDALCTISKISNKILKVVGAFYDLRLYGSQLKSGYKQTLVRKLKIKLFAIWKPIKIILKTL